MSAAIFLPPSPQHFDMIPEMWNLLFTPPLEKRKIAFLEELAQRINALEESDKVDINQLVNNDTFIDILASITSKILQTSEREKIVAFQNAILNTAKGEAPEKSKTQIFVNILNEFTIWHLKILDLMKNPKEWFESQKLPIPKSITYTISDVIYDAFPDLKDQTALLNYVCNDLARMGLLDALSSSSLRTMMTVDGALANRITPFGEEFMNFVTFKK